MSIDTATDDGVSDFLKRIKELDAKKYVSTILLTIFNILIMFTVSRNAEDELRTRQLEEQIAAGRRRRRALREGMCTSTF